MAEAKPFASLSSGLLARKGAAKPAMRPQGFGHMGMGLEDLGWNDMGYGQQAQPQPQGPEPLPEHVPSPITALTPAPRPQIDPVEVEEPVEEPAAPPVVEQQRAVEAAFAAPKPRKQQALNHANGKHPRQAPGSKGKAAFTLRLDPERHLKLRLACAVKHRSAQQLVTEALDQYLAGLPELDALAAQAGKRN